jgi:L-iditol 2-dehydrogenase
MSEIPRSMKVARLHSFEDIRIEEMPVPLPGPGEALMRTRASGICSGDVMPWYIERKAPLVIGHEPAGEIVAVGEGVTMFKPGARVFVHHHAPCFVCPRCQRGDYVHCTTWRSSRIVPGGVAEYVLIPSVNLEFDTLDLPGDISFEDAAMIEPLACVVKGLKRARVRRGDTALVIGLGFMGMLNALALRKFGASRVIGVDMQPWRLAKARALGVDDVIDASAGPLEEQVAELTEGEMAHVTVVGPNSAEALRAGLASTGAGGSVLMFTPVKPGESLTLDMNDLYFREVSLIPSYSCGPTDTADALELISSGGVPVRDLVTHRFGIDQAAEAFRLTAEARESLKCMVVF